MNENQKIIVPEAPAPTTTPTTVELPMVEKTLAFNFDELKPNSVVVIKIDQKGDQQRMAATQQIAMALRPLRDIIKAKSIAFIVMGSQESFEVLPEEQMNAVGWFKKEESRIILPH
jgi:hypothetical protein